MQCNSACKRNLSAKLQGNVQRAVSDPASGKGLADVSEHTAPRSAISSPGDAVHLVDVSGHDRIRLRHEKVGERGAEGVRRREERALMLIARLLRPRAFEAHAPHLAGRSTHLVPHAIRRGAPDFVAYRAVEPRVPQPEGVALPCGSRQEVAEAKSGERVFHEAGRWLVAPRGRRLGRPDVLRGHARHIADQPARAVAHVLSKGVADPDEIG
mmetsp:Transcript_4265/g.12650  ORF Transcript_4265/g.12650 Transcript_4265/m.12650 type:complete len:212 (-) Transcript_4265:403-1038(-)